MFFMITNVSGSGDTFTAGLASKLSMANRSSLTSNSLEEAIKYGLEAAQYSLRSKTAISKKLQPNLALSNWQTVNLTVDPIKASHKCN